MVIAYTQCLTL